VLDHKNFATLDSLVDAALDLSADKRTEFLERLAIEQPEIASHLTRILNKLDAAENFLDQNAEQARDEILIQSLDGLRELGKPDELPIPG
jgi:hypothetical protein